MFLGCHGHRAFVRFEGPRDPGRLGSPFASDHLPAVSKLTRGSQEARQLSVIFAMRPDSHGRALVNLPVNLMVSRLIDAPITGHAFADLL